MKKLISVLLLFTAVNAFSQINTERVLNIGRNALYFEDYVLSIQYFNQVIKVKPFLYEPYFYRAIAKIQLEDFNGAIQDLNKAIELNPFVPQSYYARGFAYKRLNDWKLAQTDFSKALEFSPENSTFMVNRIETYEKLKDYTDAMQDLDYLIRHNSQEPLFYFEKGNLLLQMGDTAVALQQFDILVRKDSLDPEAWGARGYVRLISGNEGGSLNDYNQAVHLNSRNVSHYINRGILLYKKNNYRGALADYDKAVALEPNNISALFNRALLRSEVGDYNNAIRDLNTIISLHPDNPEAIYQRALVNGKLGQWNSVIDDFTKIIDLYPDFLPAYYGRADAYLKLGKEKLAFTDQKRAYDLNEAHKNQKGKKKSRVNTSVQIARQDSSLIGGKTNIFADEFDNGKNSSNTIRGLVQNNNVVVTNEKNFVLSYYYQKINSLPNQEHWYSVLSQFNQEHRLEGALYIVNHEVALSQNMINYHFASINSLTKQIKDSAENSDLYFARGIDYMLVHDFDNAIQDFSKVIETGRGNELILAYFCRANARFKNLELEINMKSDKMPGNISIQNNQAIDREELLKKKYETEINHTIEDYDKAIALAPDFYYAWYNKANLLCIEKDFEDAIKAYSRAIQINGEFGEAYFNRGLAYIYLGKNKPGAADLSKAGELGIYQAYSILKKMNE